MSANLTKLMCTPMLRCTLEQSKHIYTPNVTLDHVGLRAWQSKHICQVQSAKTSSTKFDYFTHLISLLRFQYFENMIGLRFCWICHNKRLLEIQKFGDGDGGQCNVEYLSVPPQSRLSRFSRHQVNCSGRVSILLGPHRACHTLQMCHLWMRTFFQILTTDFIHGHRQCSPNFLWH